MQTIYGTFSLTYDKESATIEDLLLRRATLLTLVEGYTAFSVEIPERVSDQLSEVETEIKLRNHANLLRLLREAKSRRSTLRTADERRTDADSEIARLEGLLGGTAK